MGSINGERLFYLISCFLVLSMITSSAAEVTVDADGNAHVVIKGESSRNNQGLKDESDYYLNTRPLQNQMTDRISTYCNFATGTLNGYNGSQLDAAVNQGKSLLADIKASTIFDEEQKKSLTMRAMKCQLLILSEQVSRVGTQRGYSGSQAAPNVGAATSKQAAYRVDADVRQSGDAVQYSGRIYGPSCKQLRLDIFARSREGHMSSFSILIKNVDAGGRLFNGADRVYAYGEGWQILSTYPSCLDR